jgi:NTE family protein
MDENLLKLIQSSRIFPSLNEETIRQFADKFKLLELPTHAVLFNQGDASRNVFWVMTGKLVASLITETGEKRILGYIEAGEIVGELGAFSTEPRLLTVTVLKKAELLYLSTEDFIEICSNYPSVLFEVLTPIINRSRSTLQTLSGQTLPENVVILPANRQINIEAFASELKSYADKYKNLKMIVDKDVNLNAKATDFHETMRQLTHGIKSSQQVIYLLQSFDTPLADYAMRLANRVYIVGDSEADAQISHSILNKLEGQKPHFIATPRLILLHPENAITPKNARQWLDQYEFSLYHHVRLHNEKDFNRLLRFIRGIAVGVVLGGGGTRGFAHLGAIKAIRNAKIPIDIIGGCSAGAIAGACYALHPHYKGAFRKFRKIALHSKHSVSWFNLTWPRISLFNAKNFTEAQQEAFGETLIEDLWLPYFCISCNLTTHTEAIHLRGKLWEKTRASSSIPGIIPPMVLEGEMHLDGGAMNNLPVDVMRQLLGKKGRIIAIDLNSFTPSNERYDFPPILSMRTALFARLKFPRFIDTFLQGIFIGSWIKTKQNSLAANLLISLNLNKFRMLYVDMKQAGELAKIGYDEAGRAIVNKRR